MGTYEIAFLVGALFAVMAFLALASMLLDKGAPSIFFVFALIAVGGLYIAHVHSPDGLKIDDIPPLLYAVVGDWVK